ncbi:hypothetical protein [Candidatus Amarolinea dominans]
MAKLREHGAIQIAVVDRDRYDRRDLADDVRLKQWRPAQLNLG